MRYLFIPVILLGFFTNSISAQFIVNGSAVQTGDRCWTLTPAQKFKVGSIWNEKKISLDESFDIAVDVFLGCDRAGADGIVFAFQPVGTSVGVVGQGIGIGGVSPSIAIELDVFQNSDENDPNFDHAALIFNGIVNHGKSNTLAGPKGFATANIKDCQFHDLRVVWDAKLKKLDSYWDCTPLFSYTGDIVKNIFNGNPLVYWGFTAATGGATNEQKICIKNNTLLDNLPDTTICVGQAVKLKANGGVNDTYEWSPTKGLSNPNIAEPIARPDVTTLYKVLIKDKCQRAFRDSLTVKVGGTPFNFDLGKDSILCEGQTLKLTANVPDGQYSWQNGSTEMSFNATKTGVYGVKVVKNFCSATDSIRLKFTQAPVATLGADTILCLKNKLILNAQTEGATYKWQDGSPLSNLVVYKEGRYFVNVKNRCGESNATIFVAYEDCHKLFIPTAFSPNGDGQNEIFSIFAGDNVININTFRIFDRWGNLVYQADNFKANDVLFGWNGLRYLPGVYTYFAEVLFKDGVTEIRTGDVTLVR